MVCGRDEKKGGVTSLYRAAGESAVEELANIDADGHAVMHDETLHCVMENPRGRETIIAA
jgi:hypothetical protein